MNLPKLTAEASLYTSQATYHSWQATHAFASAVTPSQMPSGSYQQSCQNCYTQLGEDFFLFCSCYDDNGNLQPTAIAPYDCSGYDIANCNGQLTCGGCPGFY